MPSQVVSLLQEVARRFQRPARTEEEGLAAQQLTQTELAAALRGHVVTDDRKPQLKRLVLEVAAALCQFTPAAAAALSRPDALAHLPAFLGTALQVTAGCAALFFCGRLAAELELSDNDAIRFAAAAQLALVAGPLALPRLREAGRQAAADARAATDAASRAAAVAAAANFQQGVCAVLPGTLTQIFAVGGIMARLLLPASRPQAAAAFAKTTARPPQMLPWLRSVSTLLCSAPPLGVGDSFEDETVVHQAYVLYATSVHQLVDEPCWSAHGDAIAADPALQADVAEVLLLHCLPALAAAAHGSCPPDGATQLAQELQQSLTSSRLEPAAQRLLRQQHSSTSVAASLCSLAAAASAQPAEGEAGAAQCSLLCASINVAAVLAELAAGGQGALGAEASSGNGSDSNSGSTTSGNSLPGAAAWLQLAVQAVPQLCTMLLQRYDSLRECCADGEHAFDRMLAATCSNLAALLSRVEEQLPLPTCATWPEAAAAALRLQPLLARLDAPCRRLAEPQLQRAAQCLSEQLLEAVVYGSIEHFPPASARAQSAPGGGAGAAAGPTLPQLLQLHSLACRLVHWLVSSPGAALAAYPSMTAEHWRSVQDGNNAIFHLTLDACRQGRDGPLSNSTEARALCVTHLAAMQAAEAAQGAAPAAPSGGLEQRSPAALVAATACLVEAARACPAIVTSSFLQPAHAVLAPLAQDASQRLVLCGLLSGLLKHSIGTPALACSLVSTGLLAMTAECASRLAAVDAPAHREGACELLAYSTLCIGRVAAITDVIGSDAPSDLAQQAAAAADGLMEQSGALLNSSLYGPASHAHQLQQMLPAADRLAAVFDAYCQLPSQQAAVQLETARAAAARSCAYLRCRNVEGEGGALAGQGAGCKRCSGCRAVWYCGTACSHSDWREGGHRRVCKLLGEERQRRKAAQQQGELSAAC